MWLAISGGFVRIFSKLLISLVVSLCIAAGLAVLLYGGLFDFVEMRFYQPSVLASVDKILVAHVSAFEDWRADVDRLFAEYASQAVVRRSFLWNQADSDVSERAVLTGGLFSALPGLKGVRVIGSGVENAEGASETRHRIHFSTFETDMAERRDSRIVYKTYEGAGCSPPFSALERPASSGGKLSADSASGMLIFSLPFYDAYSAWRGTIAFYVSPESVEDFFIGQNLLHIGDRFTVVASADSRVCGIVRGFPGILTGGVWQSAVDGGERAAVAARLSGEIASRWAAGGASAEKTAVVEGVPVVLCSRPVSSGFFLGALLPETYFEFSESAKIFFLCAGFVTVFLLSFFILNMKQDPMELARRRMRMFQFQLLRDVIASGRLDDGDGLSRFCGELESRRREFSAEIKAGFGKRMRKKYSSEINALVDKSWDEILSALGNVRAHSPSPSADMAALKKTLERFLRSVDVKASSVDAPVNDGGAEKASPAKNNAGATRRAASPCVRTVDAEKKLEMEAFGEFEEISGRSVSACAFFEDLEELPGVEDPPAEEDARPEIDSQTGEFVPLEGILNGAELRGEAETPAAGVEEPETHENQETRSDDGGFASEAEAHPGVPEPADSDGPSGDCEKPGEAYSGAGSDVSTPDGGETSEPEYVGGFFRETTPFFPSAEASVALTVVEEAAAELLPVDDGLNEWLDTDGSIVNRDGIFVIDSSVANAKDEELDSAFKNLVDSVLL